MAIAINGSGTVTGVSVGGLPDGIVDTDMLAASAVTVAKASGSVKGITVKDQWRVSSGFTGSVNPISSNWERCDTYSPGLIGSAMSVSSGAWTFPETGIWEIEFISSSYMYDSNVRFIESNIYVTENNSDWNECARSSGSVFDSNNNTYGNNYVQFLFDVTNVSTHKVRLSRAVGNGNLTTRGDSNRNFTYATFTKVGVT